MKKNQTVIIVIISMVMLFVSSAVVWCAESADTLTALINVQKYDRAIHIMAMLLVGFGFLMVFVKRYGRSAATATYLLVSVSIPIYIMLDGFGFFGHPNMEIDRLILAEFAAASLLICAGAPFGRLKMGQYILLAIIFVPCYMLNEWITLDNGFGLIASGGFIDTGGSIVIHAFGAIFGLGVIMTMTTEKEFDLPIESDTTSDRFSMLGSMVLWISGPVFVPRWSHRNWCRIREST